MNLSYLLYNQHRTLQDPWSRNIAGRGHTPPGSLLSLCHNHYYYKVMTQNIPEIDTCQGGK